MAILYVVATPIGNLEDITLRALRVLREVKLIAAEDTRKTRRLLAAYDIKTPMTSYYEHNKMTKLDYILEQLKEADIALVSEAGMPGISDPGYELILAASRRGVKVVPVPGLRRLSPGWRSPACRPILLSLSAFYRNGLPPGGAPWKKSRTNRPLLSPWKRRTGYTPP